MKKRPLLYQKLHEGPVIVLQDYLISIEDTLVFASHPLIEKHALNATDALILRSTLNVATMLQPAGNDSVLVTSDHQLLRAAQAEGLQTFNPEINVQTELDILIQAQ